MKKVSLLAFILSATAATWASAEGQSPHCPKAFQGFHLGANVGYGVGWAKQKFSTTEAGVTDSTTNTKGLRGIDGGIGTGYLQRFGHWGLGLAFDANWTNTTGKLTSGTSEDRFTAKARLKNSLQLYGKLGYVLCGEQVMPFVGLGWDNSQWKHSATTREDGVDRSTISHSKRYNAFLWKAGVDFLATKHVVVGFEYTGTQAGSKSASRTVGGETFKASFKPQYNKFALTARVVY